MRTDRYLNQSLGMGEDTDSLWTYDEAVALMNDAGTDYFDAGYAAGLEEAGARPTTTQLVQESQGNWWDSFLKPETITNVVTAKTAYELQQINLDRIRRGLAPLPASYTNAVAPRLNVGLPDDQMKMILWGVAGIAAVAIASRMGR